jgi:hypothetical protein
MDKLAELNKAYKEVRRIKKLRGYEYGKSDCWIMFSMYDRNTNNLNSIYGMIKDYKNHIAFHKLVQKAGYKDLKDLLLSNGYKEVSFDDLQIGDVCVFDSISVDYTIAIYDGEMWVNSSDSEKYEKLPTRFVLPRARYLCRLEEHNEKF